MDVARRVTFLVKRSFTHEIAIAELGNTQFDITFGLIIQRLGTAIYIITAIPKIQQFRKTLCLPVSPALLVMLRRNKPLRVICIVGSTEFFKVGSIEVRGISHMIW